jgi:Magnesium chelatase, subunit ChlI
MKRTNDPRQIDLFGALGCKPELAPPPLFQKRLTGEPAAAFIATAQAQTDRILDFQSIEGQETAKRALEIAVAGGLSIMLRGEAACPLDRLRLATYKLADDAALPTGCPRICETDGRLYERTDLFVDVLPTHEADLRLPPPCEFTSQIIPRIVAAGAKLAALCPGFPDDAAIDAVPIHDLGKRLWLQAVEAMGLDEADQRAVKRAAIVIAALARADEMGRVHIAEALSYRPRPGDHPTEPEGPAEPEAAPEPVTPRPGPPGSGLGEHPLHASDDRPYWKTSAYLWNGEMLVHGDRPAPIELTIRGIRTVVSFGMGFATHAVEQPGTPYWSDTGFRSFTCSAETDPATVAAIIEAYIDAPAKGGNGCGGKLSPWWTLAVRQLQQHRGYMSRAERVTPEMHDRDVELAAAVTAEGYAPDRVAPLPVRRKAAA